MKIKLFCGWKLTHYPNLLSLAKSISIQSSKRVEPQSFYLQMILQLTITMCFKMHLNYILEIHFLWFLALWMEFNTNWLNTFKLLKCPQLE
jgi:hypothetical protein